MALVRFVDSIASSPTARLSLASAPWKTLDTTRFPPPGLRRAEVSSLLSDGSLTPASAYQDRTILLELQLTATDADACATQLQALFRELDRETNILQWQPDGASNPVFFRTKRADTNAVTSIRPKGGLTNISVEIPAEPFAYGSRQTLSPVTVNNNPAAGSNGMFVDVSSVKGDVETPLYLTVAGGIVVSTSAGPRTTAIAVRRRGTVASVPFFIQAESMTMAIADTTVQANNASFSGAGSNWVRTTFATSASHTARLTTTAHPSSASVDARGTYRVFVRWRFSASGTNTVTMQLKWGNSNGPVVIENDSITLPNDNGGGAPYLKYADLGLIQIPPGYDPVNDGISNTEVATEGVYLQLLAGQTSGTGDLDWDVVLLVPADDRLCLVKWPGASTPPTDLILDSAVGQVYARNASAQLTAVPGAQIQGLPPMVSPGVTNRIFFVRDVGTDTSTAGSGSGDDIAGTTSVTGYYWPRYLYVRPAST